MPLAMRNLAIAQQRQKERYSLVRGGEWAKPKASFAIGDYVMVKRLHIGKLMLATNLGLCNT